MATNFPSFQVHSDSDDYVELYTHRSLRPLDSRGYTLAWLGERLLNFAVARHWYERSPNTSPQELREKQEQSLSDQLLEDSIIKYKLFSKLNRSDRESAISLEDCRDFLNIYTGALFVQDGIENVQRWVSALIDPTASSGFDNAAVQPLASSVSSASTPASPISSTTMLSHSLSTETLPAYSPPVSDNGNLSYVTLSLFNEYAQKGNYNVTWEAKHSGAAHRLTWTVKCFLNDEVKGTGVASNQKMAKEKAVRDAWQKMGWGTTTGLAGGNALDFLTVPRFTELATRRGYEVEWEQKATGQPHMATWKLTCIVDGRPRGIGEAKNVNEAKQVAVRKAWEDLGW